MMQILNHRKLSKSKNDDYRSRSPSGLVVAPTRELALQIQDVAETYGRPLGISNMCIYGKIFINFHDESSNLIFIIEQVERRKDHKNIKCLEVLTFVLPLRVVYWIS